MYSLCSPSKPDLRENGWVLPGGLWSGFLADELESD